MTDDELLHDIAVELRGEDVSTDEHAFHLARAVLKTVRAYDQRHSDARLRALEAQKDGAYHERNECVAALAKAARALGCRVWMGKHDPADASWDRDWLTIVFVELPTGQLSWHIHDSEVYLFDGIPEGGPAWDGHTTPEKYRRLREWSPAVPGVQMGGERGDVEPLGPIVGGEAYERGRADERRDVVEWLADRPPATTGREHESWSEAIRRGEHVGAASTQREGREP